MLDDTITFGLEPTLKNKELKEENSAVVKVMLLNYEHGEPSKNK
jgi:hypothetical protein